jgi:hypothetical protein
MRALLIASCCTVLALSACAEVPGQMVPRSGTAWNPAPADTAPTITERLLSGLDADNAQYYEPLPDGRRFVFTDWQNTGELAVLDLPSRTTSALTRHSGEPWRDGWTERPRVSRDGGRVAYM